MKRERSRMNTVVLDWNWRFWCELRALSPERAWEQGYPVAVNKFCIQVMDSKCHSLLKEIKAPWKDG